MALEISPIDGATGAWHAGTMLADVSFGTIWEAVAGALPDSVAISEPDGGRPLRLVVQRRTIPVWQ